MAENNPRDPLGLLSSPGSVVKVVNTARIDLNESFGIVDSFNTERNRYIVSIVSSISSNSNQNVSLKPENLIKASFFEKTKVQAEVAWKLAKEKYNDPQVQEYVRRTYNSAHSKLGFRPEYLVWASLAFFIFSMRAFGFSKTILGSSLIIIVCLVSAPDWMNGQNLQSTVRNFPNRFRDNLVQATGYTGITRKMALGIFVISYLFSLKILFTPYSPSAPLSSKPGAPPLTQGMRATSKKFEFEELYRLGFEDASQGKEYGTSLPNLNSTSLAEPVRDLDENIDWDYPPPPVQSRRSGGFGISTVLSLLTLFRMGKELAMDAHGQPSFPLLVANLKMLPPWKLGIMGLCVYRILSPLFF